MIYDSVILVMLVNWIVCVFLFLLSQHSNQRGNWEISRGLNAITSIILHENY